jgi:Amt family ammonium transporter
MNAADTTWMLIATALVLLMTPALAFFYGGLVRSKNALNTMMMSIVSLGCVGVVWSLLGFSIAFGAGTPLLGDFSAAFMRGVGLVPAAGMTIPRLLFANYQGTFAIITAALISGAIVERMRFLPYVAFITLWSLLVYSPVAHWVWADRGWLNQLGALDFAGGTVVHITAASAALVAAVMIGPRKDFARHAVLPHNVPFTLLGAGLLWFGWFGFNGGSALAVNEHAVLAFTNTLMAPSATLLVWVALDLIRSGKATVVGGATAIVVGLVAITPAAGFVSPLSAMAIGGLVAFPSHFAILYRSRTRLDDSLDVIAAHGVGGVTGALLTGVFAQKAWGAPANGLLFGNPKQLGIQAIAVLATIVFTVAATGALLKLVTLFAALKAPATEEGQGLDISQHGEEAYTSGDGALLLLSEALPRPHTHLVPTEGGAR